MDPTVAVVVCAVSAVLVVGGVLGAIWAGWRLRAPEVEKLELLLEQSEARCKAQLEARGRDAAAAETAVEAADERAKAERLAGGGDPDAALGVLFGGGGSQPDPPTRPAT